MSTESTEATASRSNDPYQLDRRLTILETRFDTILPNLATKADLAELKAEFRTELAEVKTELRSELDSLTRWLITLTITMLLGFAGLFATMLTLLRH